MALPPHPPGPDNSDDVTIADEEWPVAEQYRVEPRPRQAAEDDGTIVIEQDNAPGGPVRRFPPDLGPGLLLALLGVLLIVVLIPAAIWLAGRDDDESAASPPTGTDGTRTATTPTQTTPTTPTATTVPEPTGLALGEAQALLEQENVRVRVRRIASNGPVGEVLEQSPAPGERLSADTVVVLTVSRASPPDRVSVPRVDGLLTSEATSLLRQARLDVEIRAVRSSQPEGTVVSQDPEPDEEVAPRTIVLLEVAGPSAPVTIEVPTRRPEGGRGATPAAGARLAVDPATGRVDAADGHGRSAVTWSGNSATKRSARATHGLQRACAGVRP